MRMPFLHDLRVAIGFLTRVSMGDVTKNGTVEVKVERAVPWFPLVGAGIGLIVGAGYIGLGHWLAPLVAAAIAVSLGVLITGAFHYDGLADMADAFGGGWTVERRMEILKDSRLGTYGTAALGLALFTEVAALSVLSDMEALRAVVAAQMMSRGFSTAAMLFGPQAGDGMGASFMARLSRPAGLASVGASVVLTLLLLRAPGLIALVAGAVVTVAVTTLASRKIGGLTGDVLGAIQVLSALAVLVVAGA